MTGRVDGLNEVLTRINAAVDEVEGGSMKGLLESGLLVQRRSQERTPVDTGNLKGSAYTRRAQGNENAVEIGYTAAYALYVHENVDQKLKGEPREDFGTTREGVSFGGGTGKGTYWESGQPKYLESALYDSEGDILDAVQRHARVDK